MWHFAHTFSIKEEESLISLRTAVSFFQNAKELFSAHGIANETGTFLNALIVVMKSKLCWFHDKMASKNEKNYNKTLAENLSLKSVLKSAAPVSLFCELALFYMKHNRFQGATALFQTALILFGDSQKFHINTYSDCQQSSFTKKFVRDQLLICYMEIYQRERVENRLKNLDRCRKKLPIFARIESQYLTYTVQI